MHKHKIIKKYNIFLIIVLVLVIIYIIYRLIVVAFGYNAILFGVPNNDNQYYDTPKECISQSLNIASSQTQKTDAYSYKDSLYVCENDEQYVEFFIADNNYDVWFFVLDKEKKDADMKYCVNYYESGIQLEEYDWKDVSNYHYMVVESEKDIVDYSGKTPDVTRFQIETINGLETKYLLFAV